VVGHFRPQELAVEEGVLSRKLHCQCQTSSLRAIVLHHLQLSLSHVTNLQSLPSLFKTLPVPSLCCQVSLIVLRLTNSVMPKTLSPASYLLPWNIQPATRISNLHSANLLQPACLHQPRLHLHFYR